KTELMMSLSLSTFLPLPFSFSTLHVFLSLGLFCFHPSRYVHIRFLLTSFFPLQGNTIPWRICPDALSLPLFFSVDALFSLSFFFSLFSFNFPVRLPPLSLTFQ